MQRPLVSVFGLDGKQKGSVAMPGVFASPIREDVVHYVHTNMAKNKRQAYAVSTKAGEQTSAESWGTGRAAARIPRVRGGGTHRSGEGAFGNMCRGGRMYAPTKVWRKWHRKINLNERRMAMTSALAASGLVPLVMARGHRIEEVSEIPLVVSSDLQTFTKTAKASQLLETLGAYEDIERVKLSRTMRAGKGKLRNRRFVQRKGPLVIYFEDSGVVRAFRNLPGVDLCHVDRLNLLELAPGGHLGRFCIWTEDAFKRLNELYGTQKKFSVLKKGFHIARPMMTVPDVSRIINSDEVQSKLKEKKEGIRRTSVKKNPLKNWNVMLRLNPYAMTLKRQQLKQELRSKEKAKKIAKKRVNKDQKKRIAAELAPEQDV